MFVDVDELFVDVFFDCVIGFFVEFVGLMFDFDEVCDSVSDVDIDVNIDEDDMFRAFFVSDASLFEWS